MNGRDTIYESCVNTNPSGPYTRPRRHPFVPLSSLPYTPARVTPDKSLLVHTTLKPQFGPKFRTEAENEGPTEVNEPERLDQRNRHIVSSDEKR